MDRQQSKELAPGSRRGARPLVRLACLLALALALALAQAEPAAAGQGCPFDDGSCQTYCNRQGCNLGYCGHFAWIQCICRKCGDEWNWYDKVHYNPDKQVNQTELDSLKLNGSAPIILTNSAGEGDAARRSQQPEQRPAAAGKQAATLTTLLIPDLSDSAKLDLNDIPDENSEKFLDYLAKNHEKLAQATGRQPQAQQQTAAGEDEPEQQQQQQQQQQQPAPLEETVEIQISSSNNQPAAKEHDSDQDEQQDGQQAPAGRLSGAQMTRLLRMAVHERLADDIY